MIRFFDSDLVIEYLVIANHQPEQQLHHSSFVRHCYLLQVFYFYFLSLILYSLSWFGLAYSYLPDWQTHNTLKCHFEVYNWEELTSNGVLVRVLIVNYKRLQSNRLACYSVLGSYLCESHNPSYPLDACLEAPKVILQMYSYIPMLQMAYVNRRRPWQHCCNLEIHCCRAYPSYQVPSLDRSYLASLLE